MKPGTRFYHLIISFIILGNLAAVGNSRKVKFNNDWLFAKDTCDFSKAEPVNLPHDWSILEKFDKTAESGNDGGYLPTGKGYYKKNLNLSVSDLNKIHRLYFEGVYMNSKVWVNGEMAGGWPYGYTSFWVNITPFLKEGNNEIIVEVDNSRQKNCRWYSGSGIYRNVWMVTTPEEYIDDRSVEIITENDGDVRIKADIIKDGEKKTDITKKIKIDNPLLWSPDEPNLYSATIEYGEDTIPVRFGFRDIEYSSEKGLLLNGKSIKLNGACLHHDNGILGAAAFDDAEYRKAQLMKNAGFNAVRTSHNPPSETFLNACDEIGLLVIDEAFDGWKEAKTPFDYSILIDEWWDKDLSSMVERDKNHPSVFCWSIGNEIIERKSPEAVERANKMANYIRNLDPQKRPVTQALAAWDSDWEIYDPLAAQHDIVGYNYMMHKAESDHFRVPERVMMQTESYPRDVWQNYERTKSNKYIIGDFVWTGLDYIGESGIGRWYYEGDVPGEHYERPLYPWHGAYCGDVDLTGLRKPVNLYRSMLWNKEDTINIAVKEPNGYKGSVKETLWGTWPTFQSWNWEGWEGKPIEVEVYSFESPVSLYLNDEFIETKDVKNGVANFTIPYEPGNLKAVAKDKKTIIKTGGKPATIKLTPDSNVLQSNGEALSFITIEIVDNEGNIIPNISLPLKLEIEGDATLQALGNADIKDEDPYYDNLHSTWNGRALAIIRAGNKPGSTKVTVSSPTLPSNEIILKIN